MILVHDTTEMSALEMQISINPLKIAFSVILFTARLRKQFVSSGILMGHHVAAAGFVLV